MKPAEDPQSIAKLLTVKARRREIRIETPPNAKRIVLRPLGSTSTEASLARNRADFAKWPPAGGRALGSTSTVGDGGDGRSRHGLRRQAGPVQWRPILESMIFGGSNSVVGSPT